MDQLPRLGKRELICMQSFTCNNVVSVWRGFLVLWVLGMGYVNLLWHSLSLPYNYLIDCLVEILNYSMLSLALIANLLRITNDNVIRNSTVLTHPLLLDSFQYS